MTLKPSKTIFIPLLLLALLAAFFPMPKPALSAGLAKPPNNLGLVGYWPLNDGTGSKAGDASGNGNTGTITGATWTAGKRGNSLDFNGTDQHVIVTASSVLNPSTALTVSAWIKPHAVDAEWGPVVESGGNLNNGTGYYFGYYPGGTTFVFYVGDGAYDGVTTALPAGQWYYVVGTYSSSGSLYLYVNGVQVSTNSHTVATISYDSNPFTIAKLDYCCATGHHFDGQIDDVRVYNRALSATEVTALYESGQVTRKSVSNQGLVGYWAMNDGTGTAVGDSSGNGYNGFFSGSVSWATGKRGGAIDFAGGNINSNNSTPFNFGNNSFSVGAWFKLDTTTSYKTIVSKGGFWANDEFVLYANSGVLYFYVDKGGVKYYTPTISLATNVWYHAFGVYDGSNINLYLNGAFVGQTAVSNLNIGNATNLRIGSGGGGSDAFDGLIDDVRVYNRALSAAEIAALYAQNETKVNASTNSKMTDGLVGLWSFDGSDVSGSTNYDKSGNSRNATSTGSPVPAIGKIGQAMNFTGSGQYATASGFSEAGTSNQPYTFAAWVKPATGETDGNIIHMSSLVGGTGWCLPPMAIVSGYARGYSWNGGGVSVTGTSTISSGVWTHIVNTWDSSGGLKIYVNGSLENTTSQATYIASGVSNYIWLAYSPAICAGDAGDFDGSVDDVRIYSRALTAAEVYRLYTLGK